MSSVSAGGARGLGGKQDVVDSLLTHILHEGMKWRRGSPIPCGVVVWLGCSPSTGCPCSHFPALMVTPHPPAASQIRALLSMCTHVHTHARLPCLCICCQHCGLHSVPMALLSTSLPPAWCVSTSFPPVPLRETPDEQPFQLSEFGLLICSCALIFLPQPNMIVLLFKIRWHSVYFSRHLKACPLFGFFIC